MEVMCMDNEEKPLVYTVAELAKRLKISLSTAYALTKVKGFPLIKIGNRKLIPAMELEMWLSEQCNGI